MEDMSSLRRVLPNDLAAEQAVIGSMIRDNGVIPVLADMITSADFYSPKYAKMFDTIVQMHDNGDTVDVITLQDKLKEKGAPEDFYSLDTLKTLFMAVPTSAYCKSYAQIVANKAILRRIIKANEEIERMCFLENGEIDEILETTEQKIFKITQQKKVNDVKPIKEMVLDVLNDIEVASKQTGSITGISTGFYDLDYMTAGLQKSDLILLAARPSMGKTAFALNIARHVIVKEKVPTVFFSLEMSGKQLTNRLISMDSKINAHNIRIGKLEPNEWTQLVESARVIGDSTLVIDDTPGISIREMQSKCRKLKLEMGIGLIIIDYLQMMTTGEKKSESRQNEISMISRSLKQIAREMQCPVIALSQLSRDVEKKDRKSKRPELSDLRDSGAIEQDADVVMFIYRDEYYNKETEDKGVAEIIIKKHRNGPIGTVKLGCKLELSKFVNLAKDDKRRATNE